MPDQPMQQFFLVIMKLENTQRKGKSGVYLMGQSKSL
jgi:hypothetical protein